MSDADVTTNILLKLETGFPSDMTAAVSKAWEATGGVMPKELVPQQRMGNEDELAGTVLYLASKVRIAPARVAVNAGQNADRDNRPVVSATGV